MYVLTWYVVTIVDDYCIPGGHYKSREKQKRRPIKSSQREFEIRKNVIL